MAKDNDLLISSGTHLQTAWAGNTFSMSTPYQAEFRTAAGTTEQVETIRSELGMYPHVKTDVFEAVVLPCNTGYMLAVLPLAGIDLLEMERKLAADPQMVDALLKREEGAVSMPTFHFVYESKLKNEIEKIGIRKVFTDLFPLVNIPNSPITEINQRVDIRVDRKGILADAETVGGGVYGGVATGQKAFDMKLNRPFLFFLRDQTTNALLFAGAVMDPSQQ